VAVSSGLKYGCCKELSYGSCIQLSKRFITQFERPPARSSIVSLINQTAAQHVFAKLRWDVPPPRRPGFSNAWGRLSTNGTCIFARCKKFAPRQL